MQKMSTFNKYMIKKIKVTVIQPLLINMVTHSSRSSLKILTHKNIYLIHNLVHTLLGLFLNIIHLFYSSWRWYIFFCNLHFFISMSWTPFHVRTYRSFLTAEQYFIVCTIIQLAGSVLRNTGLVPGFGLFLQCCSGHGGHVFMAPLGPWYKTEVLALSLLSFPFPCHCPGSLAHTLSGSGKCYLASWAFILLPVQGE